jgi:hypothetical protein
VLLPLLHRAKPAAFGLGQEPALYVALKGFDFQVLHPPELVPVLRALSDRLGRAADAR